MLDGSILVTYFDGEDEHPPRSESPVGERDQRRWPSSAGQALRGPQELLFGSCTGMILRSRCSRARDLFPSGKRHTLANPVMASCEWRSNSVASASTACSPEQSNPEQTRPEYAKEVS